MAACTCHFGKQDDTRVRHILQRCSGHARYQDAPSRAYVRAQRPNTEVFETQACSSLTEHEVIWTKKLSEWSSADTVHGARLEVHQDGTRHVTTTSRLVVVHVDALQLQVGVAMVGSCGVDAVLIRDYFPE